MKMNYLEKKNKNPKPIISVVIPTYNRKKMLKNCLESLFKQTLPKGRYECIVVDDGSSDGTEELVRRLAKTWKNHLNLRYLKQKNKGPGSARNLGVMSSNGDIIAFIDDDCIADKNWLYEINKGFDLHPQAVGVEGKTTTDKERECFTHTIINETGGGYQTCNIAYTKKVLMDIGGFDEKMPFPSHNDDTDLAIRAADRGKIIFNENAMVYHPPIKWPYCNYLREVKKISSDLYLYSKFPHQYKKFLKRTPFQIVFRKKRIVFFILLFISLFSIYAQHYVFSLFLLATIVPLQLRDIRGVKYNMKDAIIAIFLFSVVDLMYPLAYLYYKIHYIIFKSY